jgi:hypothetical protein
LVSNLALLVGWDESDIGCVAAAAYPDDALDRRQTRRIDQPSVILDEDFEDGMKVRRVKLEGIGAHCACRNSRRSREGYSEVSEVAAHAGAMDKSSFSRRLGVADSYDVVDIPMYPFQQS